MKKIVLKYWPLFIFFVACLIYYWKVFLKDYVPFPGDLMVGAYLPWLEDKWGFVTGVPVKNPLISDIFSQFYMWKSLVAESWRNFQIPLWNPYSYSGYPLLANFHSGVFYPFNIFHIIFGDIDGWRFLVIMPSLASATTMYLYLRIINVNRIGSVIGSVVYAYSGFAISWAQFVTAAQAMIWIPLIYIVLEKYFLYRKVYYLYWLPIIFFLLLTSGHFQIMVYVLIISAGYFFWKWVSIRKLSLLFSMVLPAILTVGLVAFQILPTLELSRFGLRSIENYISGYNYGLLPIKYLITMIAPDFFGNPASGNFFGVFNYHEAIFYCGVFSVFCIFLSLFLIRSNRYVRFFLIVAVISFFVGFDTFLGKAVYLYNLPGVSTSAAGRIAVISSMAISVLVGIVVSNLKNISFKKIFVSICILLTMILTIYYFALYNDKLFDSSTNQIMTLAVKRSVALRNLILPTALVFLYSLGLLISKKYAVFKFLILIVVCSEMFRFGWKYIPFVPKRIVYPETDITRFLEDKGKSEIFRIDRERAEVLPPATWMQYRLMSPSGYDPMAVYDYVKSYQEIINGNFSGNVSRYSELERYDAKALGVFNVKYLVVTKRDKFGILGGENITTNIDLKQWKKVFETKSTAIMENLYYLPRVRFVDSVKGDASIIKYSPNYIKISYKNGAGLVLLLADTWYPGWNAFVNGKKVEISRCESIFRCIKLEDNDGVIVFDFHPVSFWNGFYVSLFCGVVTITLIIWTKKKRR